MVKHPIVAYCVMESPSEPVQPKDLKTVKTELGLYYISFRAALQSYYSKNRNNRIYDKNAMWESLQSNHIQELISKKSWCGEAGHPITEDVKRILTIDPKLISHRIYDIGMSGNILYGQVDTLSSGYGIDMTKYILQELCSAFSLRALAQIQKMPNGEQLVKSRSHVVCYDWVVLPSHTEAYQDSNSKIQIFSKAISESGNNIISISKQIAIMENQIVNFIKEESNNLKLVSNVFEIAQENLTITKDLRHIILKENNETFYVKVEDKIKNDIHSYLKKM